MLNYKTVNGYQIPDLKIPDEQVTLGRYGRMRKAYLQGTQENDCSTACS